MTRAMFTLRCSSCKTMRYVNATIETARQESCPRCQARMTVIGHEETPEKPVGLAHAPAIERPYLSKSEREYIAKKARVLVMSAFEETP